MQKQQKTMQIGYRRKKNKPQELKNKIAVTFAKQQTPNRTKCCFWFFLLFSFVRLCVWFVFWKIQDLFESRHKRQAEGDQCLLTYYLVMSLGFRKNFTLPNVRYSGNTQTNCISPGILQTCMLMTVRPLTLLKILRIMPYFQHDLDNLCSWC